MLLSPRAISAASDTEHLARQPNAFRPEIESISPQPRQCAYPMGLSLRITEADQRSAFLRRHLLALFSRAMITARLLGDAMLLVGRVYPVLIAIVMLAACTTHQAERPE